MKRLLGLALVGLVGSVGCARGAGSAPPDSGGGTIDVNLGNTETVDLPQIAIDRRLGPDAGAAGLCGIYAAPDGSDTNDGSKGNPVQTLGRGIALASSGFPARSLCAASGTYNESVILSSGTNLLGGWNEADWSAGGPNSVINGGAIAVSADTLTSLVIIDHFDINSATPGTDGQSSYGMWLHSSKVIFQNGTITAANGAPGTPGTTGFAGAGGGNGGTGGAGGTDSGSIFCSSNPRPNGGTAGSSSCLGHGGGTGGKPGGYNSGLGATNGSPSADGTAGGSAGGGGTTGSPGSGGNAGADGPAGMPGSQMGSLGPDNLYAPAVGTDGTDGKPGKGGGGGGGGGGSGCATFECGSWGGGGGGGGGGGCGGSAGKAGQGGGGSFGVFLVDAQLTLVNATVLGGTGGQGGDGGAIGTGGGPGPAGGGSGGGCSSAGSGGSGGAGGKGGDGGGGGGGAGGPSIGSYSIGTSKLTSDATDSIRAGVGGTGGATPGGTAAMMGLSSDTVP